MLEDAFICLDAELFAAGSRALVLDERLILLVVLNAILPFQLIDLLVEIFVTICFIQCGCIHLLAQAPQVMPDVADGLFVLRRLLRLASIIVTEVASVKNIVSQRVEMISQGFNMMRSNEPLLLVLVRQRVLEILQVVVRGQVEVVARRDVIVNKLSAVLDHTEPFVGIVLLA